MKTNNKIIEVATAELGTKESPANSNKTKYGEWFGWNGVAWCAIFVSYCYDKAGYPLGNIGFKKGFAGCLTGYQHFKKNNEITDKPQPGDIVFFDWNNDGRYDHVGIFVKHNDDKTFHTIEGNTSETNQSNGGEVMYRVRKYGKSVLFVHPKVLDL